MTFHIKLPRPIDDVLASDIVKESVFVSPHLDKLSVTENGSSVHVELHDDTHSGEVQPKVQRFLDAMLKRSHDFETNVFFETRRRDDGPLATGVHNELVGRDWIHDYGSGQVALNGPALRLLDYIDSYAARYYARTFGAVDRSFPALVDAEMLARCGYFDSHPNAVCFVGHIVEDFDTIEEFRLNNAAGDRVVLPPPDHVRLPGMCLNPAACFPCYPTLSGETLGAEGRVFSWKGRVFRFESRNVAGLDRLWEFNVRELVFAGSEAFVRQGREQALPFISKLAKHLDLECRVETAADPFFATVAAAKTFWQRAQEVKNEIVLPVTTGEDGAVRHIACGSINLHGNFFGDRFGFKESEGEAASTACVGLGLERWVLAAFCQHGFDPDRWPAGVAKKIFL